MRKNSSVSHRRWSRFVRPSARSHQPVRVFSLPDLPVLVRKSLPASFIQVQAVPTSPLSSSIAPQCDLMPLRQSCLALNQMQTRKMNAVLSACSSVPMAAACCWMKWLICHWKLRVKLSAFCKNRLSSVSAATGKSALMFASSRQPIAILRPKSLPGAFEKTCSIG